MTTNTEAFAAEIASVRSQILTSQAKRGITLATTEGVQTFGKSLKRAYVAYDAAIAAGKTVIEFSNERGVDIRDR